MEFGNALSSEGNCAAPLRGKQEIILHYVCSTPPMLNHVLGRISITEIVGAGVPLRTVRAERKQLPHK